MNESDDFRTAFARSLGVTQRGAGLSVCLLLLAPGCNSAAPGAGDCDVGTETCGCYANSTCNDGLECLSEICVAAEGSGGASTGSGAGATGASSGESGSSGGETSSSVGSGGRSSSSGPGGSSGGSGSGGGSSTTRGSGGGSSGTGGGESTTSIGAGGSLGSGGAPAAGVHEIYFDQMTTQCWDDADPGSAYAPGTPVERLGVHIPTWKDFDTPFDFCVTRIEVLGDSSASELYWTTDAVMPASNSNNAALGIDSYWFPASDSGDELGGTSYSIPDTFEGEVGPGDALCLRGTAAQTLSASGDACDYDDTTNPPPACEPGVHWGVKLIAGFAGGEDSEPYTPSSHSFTGVRLHIEGTLPTTDQAEARFFLEESVTGGRQWCTELHQR